MFFTNLPHLLHKTTLRTSQTTLLCLPRLPFTVHADQHVFLVWLTHTTVPSPDHLHIPFPLAEKTLFLSPPPITFSDHQDHTLLLIKSIFRPTAPSILNALLLSRGGGLFDCPSLHPCVESGDPGWCTVVHQDPLVPASG